MLAACWGRTQGATRVSLWKHIRAARRAHLSRAQRAAIVDRFVWPILAHRAPTWAPTPADVFQRWCLAQCEDTFFRPGEDPALFNHRRARSAGAAARHSSLWSARLVTASKAMLESVRAEAPPHSWAARLLAVRDAAWARARRVMCGPASVYEGRIASLRLGGHVAPRRESVVQDA